MSALAMILTAAMAVPANGPEKVSGEIAEPQRQPLDLKGQWKAVLYRDGQVLKGEATLSVCWKFNVRVPLPKPGEMRFFPIGTVVDEGDGNLRVGPFDYLGIYERDEDRLRICFSEGQHRPTSFQAGEGRTLLILRCIKSGK